ncbi:MAG: diguanylate cyclase [Deltaproteobacteria bacterium]
MRNILAIGVQKDVIDRVRDRLNKQEFSVSEVQTIQEGFDFLRKNPISLILLNNELPGASYREFCILLRSQERYSAVPILLLAQKAESLDQKIEVLKSMTVNDYIAAPFIPEEIVARINVFIEVRALQEELEASNLMLKKISITDELTRLYNRRHLFERLAEELQRMSRHGYDLCVMIVDLDHFKKVNDEFGHQAGDQVLVELAQLIRTNIRSIDLAGRYGGEEFIILLPYNTLEQGMAVAERLRVKVKTHTFTPIEGHLTASFGLVAFSHKDRPSVDEAVRTADEQLYLAKKNGRNRVCHAVYRPKGVENRDNG